MFGLNEALMSFIRRQVGLRTDAADANGSLHAKTALLGTPSHSRADNTVMGWLKTSVKSAQKGSFSSELTRHTSIYTTWYGEDITISPVNPDKAIVLYSGNIVYYHATTDYRRIETAWARLIDSSTLRVEGNYEWEPSLYWQVIEFY